MIPGSANPLLLASVAGAAPSYQIERSLRFNSSDSAYLSKSITNITTFTLSYWMKRCGSGRDDTFATESSTGFFYYVHTDGSIRVNDNTANRFVSNGLYRDPSAWYHVVINNNGSTFNLYVNGVLDKSASVSLALYSGTALIGRDRVSSPSAHANFYLADVHFIDGQALDPTSFTEVSATTGQLIPKQYTGSFGTNGFWLKFSDNSAATATTLGKDYSGNNNNWSPTNLSVTAGAGNDSLVDTPTSYGTDTGAGGEVRGNYATLNPLDYLGTAFTLSNGNLDWATTTTATGSILSTIGVSTGKWYWEVTASSVPSGSFGVGVAKSGSSNFGTGQAIYVSNTGEKQIDGTATTYGATWTTNDVIGVAYDADTGAITFYKNNTSQGSFTPSGYAGATVFPVLCDGSSLAVTLTANFGQRPFAYTAPSGFKALCDTNLPAPVVAQPSTVMDVKLYTGNGSTQTISGLGFESDLLWIKRRDGANSHQLVDSARGLTKYLFSDATLAEETRTDQVTATSSTGFSLGSNAAVNASAASYVAWTWDAGSSTVTNTQGSITSSVRANASAGFSIVTYTGTGANATVGHGLGVAPQMIIVKNRSTSDDNWQVYHRSLTDANYRLVLNSTQAADSVSTMWNGTAPTSTVFSVGTQSGSNKNTSNLIAYCFAPVDGYSSFGSYTGNGSADGPFVYTGFRPRWLMVKVSSTAEVWVVLDAIRNGYNIVNEALFPNTSDSTYGAPYLDFTSNGFKIRNTGSGTNTSGATYIYAAFAESPFQYSRAR